MQGPQKTHLGELENANIKLPVNPLQKKQQTRAFLAWLLLGVDLQVATPLPIGSYRQQDNRMPYM